MAENGLFNAELIQRYDTAGPRYTSYPTALQFSPSFTDEDYIAVAQRTNEDLIPRPLSLYVHLPFCATVCYYCACNKVITKNRDHAGPYLQSLHEEIRLHSELYDADRIVKQLHLGGGTPTFISSQQMMSLMHQIRRYFTLLEDDSGEYSIELDPREVRMNTLVQLRQLGFNRISLGVQDLDATVQKAVNRIQPIDTTERVITQARDLKFHSISLDLIYGLPQQTVQSFKTTLDRIITLQPDRIAIYNYAHMPERFKVQRQIKSEDLPSAEEKLSILQQAITRLTSAGYVYIGMDHFARADDELAIAQRQGTLQRNFQGYSTHADCDLIALGVSAISKVGDTYSQNVKDIVQYQTRIDIGQIPISQGVALSYDDQLRRDVITQLMCHFHVDLQKITAMYEMHAIDYFADELDQLEMMQSDGMLMINGSQISVAPQGRLLIRNICAVFDRYNQPVQNKAQFSRMI